MAETVQNLTPKEYLSQYKLLGMRIEAKVQQAEELRRKAQTVSGGNSGGAHSSAPYDRIGELTAKIVDLEREINAEIDSLVELRREIGERIGQVRSDKLRTLLELRYINCMTFEQIAVHMNYSYKQVCRLHGQALTQVRCP